MKKLNKSILITGIKHSGKSTVGKLLSYRYSADFYDLDGLAEHIFHAETGESLNSRQIYRRGREVFREYEYKAVCEAAGISENKPLICAAGGGICDNRSALKTAGEAFVIVYIFEEADVLYKRIIRGGIPAFLSETDPYRNFLRLYETRTAIYDNIADIKVFSAGRTAAEISSDIEKRLREENHAG